MKAKTIKKALRSKTNDWLASIEDEFVRKLAAQNCIVTGGAIASMLLQEPDNDYDIYFKTREATEAVGRYYVERFKTATGHELALNVDEDGRVRITTKNGYRGETQGDVTTLQDSGEIEDAYDDTEALALKDDSKPKYRPVFLSTNAITLSQKIQIILRFYGEPDAIHENYDFVHCTNYWSSWNGVLCLRAAALESLLARELRYVGSKYPLCSFIRTRKFVARQWTINAGQFLKMAMQLNDLDLTDMAVLEDQLTGVDAAYFMEVISALKTRDDKKVDRAYLIELIDKIF